MTLKVRVSPDELSALKAYAKRQRLPLSTVVRQVLMVVAQEGVYPPPPKPRKERP